MVMATWRSTADRKWLANRYVGSQVQKTSQQVPMDNRFKFASEIEHSVEKISRRQSRGINEAQKRKEQTNVVADLFKDVTDNTVLREEAVRTGSGELRGLAALQHYMEVRDGLLRATL